MTLQIDNDEKYMRHAIALARRAMSEGEVPVGCVIVHEGTIIARAYNQRELLHDPTAHAEMIALTQASGALGRWRLSGTTVYCTVEPCCMCAGAMVNARVERVVFGISDPKSGGCGSVFDIVREPRLNHRAEVRKGVLETECLALLQDFFAERRRKNESRTTEKNEGHNFVQ